MAHTDTFSLDIPTRAGAASVSLFLDKPTTVTITNRYGATILATQAPADEDWKPPTDLTTLTDDQFPLTLTTTS